MEDSINIDRQGRLVLPSHIRKLLGLKEGGRVTIRLDGRRAVLEPEPVDYKERVQEWVNSALALKAEAFTEESEESWKWMSREYARRKLGLP
ncbi:MAG: AbrB/MazE/SpoVT family DNA-binding domain-containing protein [Aigarchaeota archaeon]|nr:AbrB/MazE/SpoVT family DNA-binding domain-containing protein [Candidatus Pelearchaeum maunauluense]